MNKKLLGIFAVVIGVASVASASPVACGPPPPPAQIVVQIGGGPSAFSYSCGGLTFSNFSATDFGNSNGVFVTLGDANFDSATGYVNLTFSPNLLNVQAFQDFHLFFTVTGAINGIDLSVGGALASINERACKNGVLVSGNCTTGEDQLASLINSSGATNVSASFAQNTSTFIYKDIGHQVGGDLTSFTQSFHTSTVPEPMTLSMMGIGLLGLGLARRKQMGKK
jgi:hypothetical protein